MMFTQCPECMTVFSVDASTLARAHGCVSCCQCGATFDSMATLSERLPEEPFEALPINEPAAAPPLLLQPVEHEKPPQQRLFESELEAQVSDQQPQQAPGAGFPDSELDDNMPSFGHLSRRRSRLPKGSRRLIFASIVLVLVLVGQLAWAERASLVKSPAIASLMRSTCAVFGCTVPMARDIRQLELTSRDIRRHPSVDGALLISATVRNNARFRQPWPVIGITLSNLDDHKVAMRRFRPAEYLHDAATRRAGLAPGASAALVFEVLDPGRDAVAFEFDFE